MNRRNKNVESKVRNKAASKNEGKRKSPKLDEDFNTGSHSPLSLRKVGAGYDDTGMGNGSQAPGPGKNVSSPQKKLKGNTEKIRKVINSSRKPR